jgi:hypothetical protein
MAHLSGMGIGTHARTLAVALLLGTAIVSFSGGQAAHAASSNPQEMVRIAIADPDSGGGPEDPASNVERRRKHPVDNGIRCSITHPDGHIDLYLPGTIIIRDGRWVMCEENGQWKVLLRSGGAGDVGSPTTGTNAP